MKRIQESTRSPWPSATCSDPRGAGRIGLARAGALLLLAAAALLAFRPAEAKVFMTRDQALELAFGGPGLAEQRTAYLTDEQASRIREAAGTAPGSRVIVYYVGGAPGRPLAAYFDTHLVRTLPETVMVTVTPEGTVGRVEILSFDEPEDYLPKPRWLEQFDGRKLDEDLSTRRGIRAVTGATLSSRAITETIRRILALHGEIGPPVPTEKRPPVQETNRPEGEGRKSP